MSKIIMGISISSRNEDAVKVQKLLSEYGCYIKTRLGLHNATDDRTHCSDDGLILLEFIQDGDAEANELKSKLEQLGSITTKIMEF